MHNKSGRLKSSGRLFQRHSLAMVLY